MGKARIISDLGKGKYKVKIEYNRDEIDAKKDALLTDFDNPNSANLVEYIDNNVAEDFQKDIWCIDYSEGLVGQVGTIEVTEETADYVNIRAAYDSDNADYKASRDGQLNDILNMTPESAFLNLALLPGVQKFSPAYRYGTLTAIDYDNDTGTVTLEDIKSSQKNHGVPYSINKYSTLENIKIEYMSCNAGAFQSGDVVVIEFEDRDWDKAKIVGFKEEPKPCEAYYVIIEASFKGQQKFVIWNAKTNSIEDIEGITQPMNFQQFYSSKVYNSTVESSVENCYNISSLSDGTGTATTLWTRGDSPLPFEYRVDIIELLYNQYYEPYWGITGTEWRSGTARGDDDHYRTSVFSDSYYKGLGSFRFTISDNLAGAGATAEVRSHLLTSSDQYVIEDNEGCPKRGADEIIGGKLVHLYGYASNEQGRNYSTEVKQQTWFSSGDWDFISGSGGDSYRNVCAPGQYYPNDEYAGPNVHIILDETREGIMIGEINHGYTGTCFYDGYGGFYAKYGNKTMVQFFYNQYKLSTKTSPNSTATITAQDRVMYACCSFNEDGIESQNPLTQPRNVAFEDAIKLASDAAKAPYPNATDKYDPYITLTIRGII